MECRCDELRDKIRNMVITFRNDSNDAIAEINRLSTQLAEAAKAAEEMELALQKASDESRKQLAERDAVVAEKVVERARLADENAALRAEVERLKEHASDYGNALITVRDETRKQAAREILDALTQEEIRRITSVGEPRVTTISSKLLAMMAELRQRYGLEGEG